MHHHHCTGHWTHMTIICGVYSLPHLCILFFFVCAVHCVSCKYVFFLSFIIPFSTSHNHIVYVSNKRMELQLCVLCIMYFIQLFSRSNYWLCAIVTASHCLCLFWHLATWNPFFIGSILH